MYFGEKQKLEQNRARDDSNQNQVIFRSQSAYLVHRLVVKCIWNSCTESLHRWLHI